MTICITCNNNSEFENLRNNRDGMFMILIKIKTKIYFVKFLLHISAWGCQHLTLRKPTSGLPTARNPR